MSIKRAGPFSSFSNSFLDDSNTENYPVNCALDYGAPTWPWRYYTRENFEDTIFLKIINSAPQTEGGTQTVPSLFGVPVIWFAYQATSSITFPFSYSAENADEGEGNSVFVSLLVNSVNVFEDGDLQFSTNASVSGATSVTLPASTKPSFVQFAVEMASSASSWSFTFDPITPA